MLDKFTKEVELFYEWHERAKEVTITAESMDPESTSYIQPLHELRYALDHFSRAIGYEKESRKDEDIVKAINSAIGHLQRAYADSVEWILITTLREYQRIVGIYTAEQINTVFPEYYTEIRPDVENIIDMVNDYKINKSVEKASNTDIISDEEAQYLNELTNQFISIDVINKLKSYLKTLHKKEIYLIEISEAERIKKEEEEKEQARKDRRDKIWIPIITSVVSGLVVGFLVYYFKWQ